jgi:hypothetical protein
MALSLGTMAPLLSQRTRFTWPRPCLLRPRLRRFFVIFAGSVLVRGREGHLNCGEAPEQSQPACPAAPTCHSQLGPTVPSAIQATQKHASVD